MQHPLTRTTLATICFYDALAYPLTAFEVWRFLMFEDPAVASQYRATQPLRAVVSTLQTLCRDGRLVCRDGFYVLPGREDLIDRRRRRGIVSGDKLARMRRAVRIVRLLPFMRQVWVTGRLAMKHAVAGSDWDVLIVLKDGHIWIGRLIVTAVLQVLGLRRTDGHHADHLCLNYWVTTGSMAISLDDRYSAHEYTMARPLWASVDPERFLAANAWISRFRPQFDAIVLPGALRVADTAVAYRVRRFLEWLCGSPRIEAWARRWQRAKIMANPKTVQKGSMIIANDRELIFLPSPHSPRVMARYHAACEREGLRLCA